MSKKAGLQGARGGTWLLYRQFKKQRFQPGKDLPRIKPDLHQSEQRKGRDDPSSEVIIIGTKKR